MLGEDADSDYRDHKTQVAQDEIGRDHLCPPFGWREAVGSRETADENATNGDACASCASQEETERCLRQPSDNEGEDQEK